MEKLLITPVNNIELNDNAPKINRSITCYEIMHGEKKVAEINSQGMASVLNERFMPYDLYLEDEKDFDTCFNNILNFQHEKGRGRISCPVSGRTKPARQEL